MACHKLKMASEGGIPIVHVTAVTDVLFVVGNPPALKLAVSSTTLSNASKVFKALFKPLFKEGRELQEAEQLKEIMLPEDHAQSMNDLCHIIHGNSPEKYLSSVDVENVLRLAIAANKYACVDAMKFHSRAILLSNLRDIKNSRHHAAIGVQTMIAAYLLNDPKVFGMCTSRLIRNTSFDHHCNLATEWLCHVPFKVLCA